MEGARLFISFCDVIMQNLIAVFYSIYIYIYIYIHIQTHSQQSALTNVVGSLQEDKS